MSLEEIVDIILNNEEDFLNDNGFFDREYIIERFNLSKEQYKKIVNLLEF